ncbi:MAG: hypothetical protein AAFS10_26725, partial [Myxococcota bacterium]
MKLNRRQFNIRGFKAALGLSLGSAITGLPLGFLLRRDIQAAELPHKFLILSMSGDGEPMNVNGPGAWGSELASTIRHPSSNISAGIASSEINGTLYTAADIANSAPLMLGDQRVEAARCYQALPEGFLRNLSYNLYNSGVQAHPEFKRVITVHGHIVGQDNTGVSTLASAIAEEMGPLLGTSTALPFVISGNFTHKGVPITPYAPLVLKETMLSRGNVLGGARNFGHAYDHLMNRVYSDVRSGGNPTHRAFLDRYANSRADATMLGDQLTALLEDVQGNSEADAFKAALALIKIRFAPVIVVKHDYGRDNHADENLEREASATLNMMQALNVYWDKAGELGLRDEVVYATLDVFGRNPGGVDSSGGRGHFGVFTAGMIHGSHITGGLVGGITQGGRDNNQVVAAPFNTLDGT